MRERKTAMGFSWNGTHTDTLGIYTQLVNLPLLPEPKIVTEEPAGGDGFFDFSAFNPKGRVLYKERLWQFDCGIRRGSRSSARAAINGLAVMFANPQGVLIVDEFPNERWSGVVTNAINISEVGRVLGKFTVYFRTQPFSVGNEPS